MATTKRPAWRKGDRVMLAEHKGVIPPYDGKPFVLRDTVLTVSHLTGTGSRRNPWHVVVTDGEHFWHLDPDDVVSAETHSTMKQTAARDLDAWLERHGYHHARARKIASPITGRELFPTSERGHHITTAGRLILAADQFALPPGPEEKRRGIKGRLPIDTIKRARNALARAAQMKKRGHISAGQLAAAQRKVHAAWPSIASGA